VSGKRRKFGNKKKEVFMATVKSGIPGLFNDRWLTDLFNTERLYDPHWLKRVQEVPAVNVVETEKDFEIRMAAPGLKKEDFKITVENDLLTVAVEKESESEERESTYTRQEFSYTRFVRSFSLPDNVQAEQVKARYENGILSLSLPKETPARAQPKSIEVK
jgi:HSP20 family protein